MWFFIKSFSRDFWCWTVGPFAPQSHMDTHMTSRVKQSIQHNQSYLTWPPTYRWPDTPRQGSTRPQCLPFRSTLTSSTTAAPGNTQGTEAPGPISKGLMDNSRGELPSVCSSLSTWARIQGWAFILQGPPRHSWNPTLARSFSSQLKLKFQCPFSLSSEKQGNKGGRKEAKKGEMNRQRGGRETERGWREGGNCLLWKQNKLRNLEINTRLNSNTTRLFCPFWEIKLSSKAKGFEGNSIYLGFTYTKYHRFLKQLRLGTHNHPPPRSGSLGLLPAFDTVRIPNPSIEM